MSRRWSIGVTLTVVVFAAAAEPVSAHVLSGQAEGFVSGFSHPISGMDHVLAMVLVGVWGAQLGPPAMWRLPVLFPMVMAVGGFLGLVGVALPAVEPGIALSAILLGLAVATEAKPPFRAAAVLVGAFAVYHGHAHGTELPPGQSGLTYSIGFVVATGCLHGIGIAFGLVHKWPVGRMTLRAVGVLVAAAGVGFMWRALS